MSSHQDMSPQPTKTESHQLRDEFNRWAKAGRGAGMEREHLPIVIPTLALMGLRPDDRVLDVGCGSGWLCRMIARQTPAGQVVGIDVSDEMVGLARKDSAEFSNISFLVGKAEAIPWESNYFSKIISVESAYYWPDPARGIQDVFRVTAGGGSAWVLINYYRDNPYCHQWGPMLSIPTRLLSSEEWAGFFSDAGFVDVEHRRIPDPTPTPPVYEGKWYQDAEQLRKFREAGALLVSGHKPVREIPWA